MILCRYLYLISYFLTTTSKEVEWFSPNIYKSYYLTTNFLFSFNQVFFFFFFNTMIDRLSFSICIGCQVHKFLRLETLLSFKPFFLLSSFERWSKKFFCLFLTPFLTWTTLTNFCSREGNVIKEWKILGNLLQSFVI